MFACVSRKKDILPILRLPKIKKRKKENFSVLRLYFFEPQEPQTPILRLY